MASKRIFKTAEGFTKTLMLGFGICIFLGIIYVALTGAITSRGSEEFAGSMLAVVSFGIITLTLIVAITKALYQLLQKK